MSGGRSSPRWSGLYPGPFELAAKGALSDSETSRHGQQRITFAQHLGGSQHVGVRKLADARSPRDTPSFQMAQDGHATDPVAADHLRHRGATLVGLDEFIDRADGESPLDLAAPRRRRWLWEIIWRQLTNLERRRGEGV